MERVLARNRELEDEIENLRSQITVHSAPVTASQNSRGIPEELMIPQKVELEWMPGSNPTWAHSTLPSHIPALQADSAVSSPYTNDAPIYSTTPMSKNGYGEDEEAAQQMYTQEAQAIPIWDDPMVFGTQATLSQNLTKPAAWGPFHPAFSQPSRFADLQQDGFADVINNPSYGSSTSWQSQPSVYAWQISTKIKAPTTQVDHLMMSVIHSQRPPGHNIRS